MLKKFAKSVLLASLIACLNANPAWSLVSYWQDGDTLAPVRVACIDTPEIPHTPEQEARQDPISINQYTMGRKALTRANELLALGKNQINIKILTVDQYGRDIGNITLGDGTDFAYRLVSEGLAIIVEPFLKQCANAAQLQAAQQKAQQLKLGIWAIQNDWLPPYKFRKLYS